MPAQNKRKTFISLGKAAQLQIYSPAQAINWHSVT